MTDKDTAIWTEKYRPKDFSEIKGQKEIVQRVKAFVAQKNMPHQLYAGPAGVGKSTLAIVVAKKLFGDQWRQNFLELNASDERGIDIVRVKVKDFARTKAIGDVPFKIIFLDECDALTREAQQALRRTMENYTSTCRFILSCVTLDTKILLPHEQEVMVKEFINQYEHNPKQIHIENLSANSNSTKKDLVLAAVQMPPSAIGKKVLEITTMTGRKIKITDDHKLLTTNGWKESGKLTKEDNLLIHPHLEGTPAEDNPKKIINLNEFIKFLSQTEEQDGLKSVEKASSYRKLKSTEKDKIHQRIAELKNITKQDNGLTKREFQLYSLVKQKGEISRAELQEKLGISRIGVNYLLPSIERKGCIKRIINKKRHSFIIGLSNSLILRNDMDIRKAIENEFNIKISYTAVKKSSLELNRGRIDRIIGELKRKELIDIAYNDFEKAGALARICGFMLGDGHLAQTSIRFHFSGNREALKEVQKDLGVLGYLNYSVIRSVTLANELMGRKFKGISTSFTLDSKAFSLLLQYLGIPKGDKTITSFRVPKFIKNGTKFVKREFLRALFGCDADKPNYKKMNFGALSLRQNKSVSLKKEMITYYKEISSILSSFEVDSYITIRDKGEIRKRDNVSVYTFGLIIRPNNLNLFKYFSRIGYSYEQYKINLARLSAEYLRHKLNLIELWKEKSKMTITAVNSGKGIRETAREYDVTPDFVSNQLKGKEVHLPRKEFMSVEDWVRKYKFNDTLIINEILSIKEVDEPLVMDITCHKDHNFITNGLISHNCNYSSKILDPIQSRCAVFRFKPLDKKELNQIIERITKDENLKVTDKAKEALEEVSGGDCRRLENIMQSCAAMSKNITEDLIYSLASVAQPKEVKEILTLATENKFVEARDKLLDTMLNHSLSGLDIIKQIQKTILDLDINNRTKMELIEKCGEIEFRMTEGSDEFIQLECLLAQFTLANSNKKV